MTHGSADVMIWSRPAWRITIGDGPGIGHRPGDLPDDPARGRIERQQLRFRRPRRSLIELHQQEILVGGQRGGVAVAVFGQAQALRPGQLAGEIKRGQVAVGEDGKHAAAVGGGRRRGVARVVVHLRRPGRALRRAGHGLPPQQLAAVGVEAIDLAAALVGAGEEHAIAPDHRRIVARQRHGRFPDDPLARLGVPRFGHVGVGGNAQSAGPAEPRPRLGDVGPFSIWDRVSRSPLPLGEG